MIRLGWRTTQRVTMVVALSGLVAWLPAEVAAGSQGSATEGQWLVESLPPQDRLLNHQHSRLDVRHELPADARQGGAAWYTFRLRARITFNAGGGREGIESRLQAATNSRASNLVTIRRQGSGVRVFHDGYIGGSFEKIVTGSSIELDYENYVQATGVQGGENHFEFSLDDPADLVAEVLIHPDSGLTRTNVAPEQLKLEAPDVVRTTRNERFDIPYRVTRRGERPDRPLVVTADAAGGPLALDGARHDYESVGGGREARFSGVATEPGTYHVGLTAGGGYNGQSHLVVVQVDPPAFWATAAGRVMLAILVVVVAGCSVSWLLRRTTVRRAGQDAKN